MFIIHSCKKDNANASTTDTAVSAEKQWYESAYPVTGNNSTLSRSLSRVNTAAANNTPGLDFSGLIKPDWSHAATYSRFGKKVVELPIDPASDKISGSLKMGAGGAILYDKNNSHTSFLLLNDGKNYQAFIMIFIADTSYLKNDHSKLMNNTYRHTDKNISGVLLYFTPKGRFVSGWFYKNGIIVRNIQGNLNAVNNTMGSKVRNLASGRTLNAPNVGKSKTRDLVCTDWYADYYFNDEFWYSEYLGTTCYDSSTEITNGGGGGGGGGFPALDGGGSGTTVNVNDTTKTDTTLLKATNLSQIQKDSLQTVFNQILSDCLGQANYSYFKANSITFSVTVDPNLPAQAAYNPVTGIIIVQNPSTLTPAALQEEFFHAYQNLTMPGGTAQYAGATGDANIEFEAKLLRDMDYYINPTNATPFALNTSDYYAWLGTLTNGGTSFPTSFTPTQLTQYKLYLSEWLNQSTDYSSDIIKSGLNPTAMFSLIQSSPCSKQ